MHNRIREFRERKGWSQSDLGEAIGVGWQTVQRAEAGKSGLTLAKKRRYAKALDTDVDTLFSPSALRWVQVRAYIQAGHWAETWELPEEDQYSVAIPFDEAFAHYTLYGAEARGPSMNKRYPEGTALIFTDAIETKEDIEVGRRYIVERQRSDGLREATVKTLWQDDAGRVWLLPESSDPRFQEPIPLEGNDDDTIRIVGRIRYAVSRE